MSTPLKALIQERLRAKIVENTIVPSSDDESRNPYESLSSPPCSEMKPLLDSNANSMPLSRGRPREPSGRNSSAHRGSTDDTVGFDEDLKHYNADLRYESYDFSAVRHDVTENDYQECIRFDRDERSPKITDSQELVSPVEALSGKKRKWKEVVDAHSPRLERVYYARQERLPAESITHRDRCPDEVPRPSQTRKNNDLSDVYQRYRELNDNRERPRPESSPGKQEEEICVDVSSPVPWRSNSMQAPSRFKSGTHHDSLKDEIDASMQRPSRWSSSPLKSEESLTSEERIRHSRSNAEAAKSHYDRRHEFSAEHRSKPKCERADVSSRAHSRYCELTPPRLGRRRRDWGHPSECHDNKIVFHSTLRGPIAPRSPGARLFLPHDDPAAIAPLLPHGHDADETLSPDSQQAAKEFVEKRQKRTAQGTPRTMATHRWLQSMVDSGRGPLDSPRAPTLTPLTAILGDDEDSELRRPACEFSGSGEDRERRRREDTRDSSSAPVYSPLRYASFSSAV